MKAYLFPGQGSQFKGMGSELFDYFKEITTQADDILGYSIKTLCVTDPNKALGLTQFTQPALYVVNALSYLKMIEQNSVLPDFVAGHSLGEYNALFASGVIDFATGLRLVKVRGELMSKAHDGGMAAILNCDQDLIQALLKDNALHGIDVANFNSPKQIVISGPLNELQRASAVFEKAGAMFIPLKVSAAFHSRYMQPAAAQFGEVLKPIALSLPKIPVIANVTARPYTVNDFVNNLQTQICGAVQWTNTIRYLLGAGVSTFQEIGPGDVLTKLVKSIRTHAVPLVIDNGAKNMGRYIGPEQLGSAAFRKAYNLRYAYLAGAMVKGIASKELVIRMGKAGLMGYFGTGGLKLDVIEKEIQAIQQALVKGESYGMNLLSNLNNPSLEMETVDLFLRYGVTNIEAAAFIQLSPALVKFRLKGLAQDQHGKIIIKHKILAKISRPEVSEVFLNPAPARVIEQLVNAGVITREQAALAQSVPMADDICVESDSGGHTDMGIMTALLPTIIRQRDEIGQKLAYAEKVRIGAAGGIGTPEAAAAAFILGAEFILTGSVNQCTVEAGTSPDVKDMLAQMNVQDTDYAPAGDMFELGARIQVLKKGVFFPARANKLYELWRMYNVWEDIDLKTRQQIESRYFGRSFAEVYAETKNYYMKHLPQEIEKAEKNAKHKLALVFRWYFIHTTRLALNGVVTDRVNYQVHTGPAMGAFNQWVKGTELQEWRNRHVDVIAEKIMQGTAELLQRKMDTWFN